MSEPLEPVPPYTPEEIAAVAVLLKKADKSTLENLLLAARTNDDIPKLCLVVRAWCLELGPEAGPAIANLIAAIDAVLA